MTSNPGAAAEVFNERRLGVSGRRGREPAQSEVVALAPLVDAAHLDGVVCGDNPLAVDLSAGQVHLWEPGGVLGGADQGAVGGAVDEEAAPGLEVMVRCRSGRCRRVKATQQRREDVCGLEPRQVPAVLERHVLCGRESSP